MARVIDTLITRFAFTTNTAALNALEARIAKTRATLNSASMMTLGWGAAAAGAVAGVTSAGITTDRAFRALMDVTRQSADEMQRFKELAYEVGSGLPLDTADILDASAQLIQLGLDADQSFTLTPIVAQAAVATGGEVPTIAKYVADLMNTYGFAAENVSPVIDMLVKAGKITPANFLDIGGALKSSAAFLRETETPINDYIALLGNMAASGLSAEESSRGLNDAMNRLFRSITTGETSEGTQQLLKAMEKIDISKEDLREIMTQDRGFMKLLETIGERAGHDASLLATIMYTMGGTTYSSPLISLMRNINEVVKDGDDLLDSQSETAKSAAVRMGGLSGAWEGFKAMLDTLRNVMNDITEDGSGMEEVFRKAADALNFLLQKGEDGERRFGWILKIASDVMMWGTGLLLVSVILKGLSFLLGGLVPLLKLASWAGGLFTASTAASATALTAQNAAVAAGTVGMTALRVAMMAIPIVALIAGIAALIIYWDDVAAAAKKAWEAFKEFTGFNPETQKVLIEAEVVYGGADLVPDDVKNQKIEVEIGNWKGLETLEQRREAYLAEQAALKEQGFQLDFSTLINNLRELDATQKPDVDWSGLWSGFKNWWSEDVDEPPDWIKPGSRQEANWFDIRNRLEQENERSSNQMAAVGEWFDNIRSSLTQLEAWWTSLPIRAAAFMNNALDQMAESVGNAFDWIGGAFDGMIFGLFDSMSEAVGNAFEWIGSSLDAMLDGMFGLLPDWLTGFISNEPTGETVVAAPEANNTLANEFTQGLTEALDSRLEGIFINAPDAEPVTLGETIVPEAAPAGESLAGFEIPIPEWFSNLVGSPQAAPVQEGLIAGRSPEGVTAPITSQSIANNQSRNVSVGDVHVSVDGAGANAAEIAQNVGQVLRDQTHLIVDAVDSPIRL